MIGTRISKREKRGCVLRQGKRVYKLKEMVWSMDLLFF